MGQVVTSLVDARRIAIVAQGFGTPRSEDPSKGPSKARLLEEVRRLAVLQIDSVNVLARAHYVPLFARLGAYDRTRLDALAWGGTRASSPSPLFEYWCHQASFAPVELYPLFRFRMLRARRGEGTWGRIARFAKEKRAYLRAVIREIEERGPLAASELTGAKKTTSGWWEWSESKHAVETLFWQGKLAVASRRGTFERLYDVPERVIPAAQLEAPTVKDVDAHRELLTISARALGIGTEEDLADYYRLARRECAPRIRELVEEGVLTETKVEGWAKTAYVHRDFASRPRSSKIRDVASLVGPFDPIVWHRARAHRLFDFHYRIGIYTPAHQRVHGYYVMPFLLGDDLAARVDLKADRGEGVLRVQAAWLEEGRDADVVASALAHELRRMARWLGLPSVVVVRKGTLAPALRATLRA